MTVLVCAATRAELSACARGIADAALAGAPFTLLLTGVGPAHATRALQAHLAEHAGAGRPRRIVSSGFAGALPGALAVGAWVTASRLGAWTGDAIDEVSGATLEQAPPPAVSVALVSTPELLGAKSALATAGVAAGYAAVDMESAALAHVAAGHGVPFVVLRMISDSPDQPLPEFLAPFTSAMAGGGTRARLGQIARGVRGALGDPRGVARVVRDGSGWSRDLAAGWRTFAKGLS